MATEYRTETVFTWGAPPLKFGVGALDELGFDLGQLGLSRVLIVTDEGVAATGIPARAAMPSGIGAVGFSADDVPDLVEGTLKQQRILAMAPRDVMPEDLAAIFRDSIANW
jgi:alcohol dehydrogenase class IV